MARSQVAYQILGSVLVLLPERVGNNAYFTLSWGSASVSLSVKWGL